MSQEKKKDLPEPSEGFKLAIISSGSPCIDCELCGRTHFVTEGKGVFYDPGEYADLVKRADKEPEKFFERGDVDSISWGHIDGRQAVVDCPCHGLYRYEGWIWNHRHLIADYLSKRAHEESEDAKYQKEQLLPKLKKFTLFREPRKVE